MASYRKLPSIISILFATAISLKKYSVPGLNWGPLACKASVITTRPTEPRGRENMSWVFYKNLGLHILLTQIDASNTFCLLGKEESS